MSIIHTRPPVTATGGITTRSDGTNQAIKRAWVDDQGVLIIEFEDGT